MGGMLLTDKLVFRWLEGFGAWSLDSATPCQSLLTALTLVARRKWSFSHGEQKGQVQEGLRKGEGSLIRK